MGFGLLVYFVSMDSQPPVDLNVMMSSVALLLSSDSSVTEELPNIDSIDKKKLTYSIDSLQFVDDFLLEIKKIKSLSDQQLFAVILRCGAYCGEVIRRTSKQKFTWISFDEAATKDPMLNNIGKSLLTAFIIKNTYLQDKLLRPSSTCDSFLSKNCA